MENTLRINSIKPDNFGHANLHFRNDWQAKRCHANSRLLVFEAEAMDNMGFYHRLTNSFCGYPVPFIW